MDKRIGLIQEGAGWVALELDSVEVPGDEVEGPRFVKWEVRGEKIAEAASLSDALSQLSAHVPDAPSSGDLAAKLPKPAKITYTYRVTRDEWNKVMQAFYGGPEKVIDGRRVRLESVRPFDNADGTKNIVVTCTPMAEKSMPGAEEME